MARPGGRLYDTTTGVLGETVLALSPGLTLTTASGDNVVVVEAGAEVAVRRTAETVRARCRWLASPRYFVRGEEEHAATQTATMRTSTVGVAFENGRYRAVPGREHWRQRLI